MPTATQLASIASINPATGEVLREFDCAGEEEVRAAVARARAAQPAWQELGIGKRLQVLRRFQTLLQERKADVARLITQEAGKPYVESLLTEVLVVLDATQFLIANARGLLRDQRIGHANLVMKAKRGRVRREPYGVLGIISPWNYPFNIPATEGLAALAAGNAVVVKPSEFTSLSALELQALLRSAGVPEDIFQVLVGAGATGAALANSQIDKLIFTGSVASGKKVAQATSSLDSFWISSHFGSSAWRPLPIMAHSDTRAPPGSAQPGPSQCRPSGRPGRVRGSRSRTHLITAPRRAEGVGATNSRTPGRGWRLPRIRSR